MKKRCIVLLTVMLSTMSYGQVKGDLEVGFGVGNNRATVNFSNNLSPQSNSSVSLNASADYNFSNRWSVKTKVIFDSKGWDDGTLYFRGGQLWDADVDLHYLTIPLMLNWHFGGKRNWYLNFGTYWGFLMAAGEETFDVDVKEAFRETDFGLTLGIGAKIPVSRYIKLYIEYDFQSGLNSIYKDSMIPEVRNVRSALNVGVNFLVL